MRQLASAVSAEVVKDEMKRPFAASVWREGDWYVSHCLEVDVASQGQTEEEALSNLREALELHFEAPLSTRPPTARVIEVEVGAALAAHL
jgi:predicted RNase H-like HicB family nuclease